MFEDAESVATFAWADLSSGKLTENRLIQMSPEAKIHLIGLLRDAYLATIGEDDPNSSVATAYITRLIELVQTNDVTQLRQLETARIAEDGGRN